jgi:hypothetical protein
MKQKQPKPKPSPRKGAAKQRDIFALFDLAFKKLIRLSARAVTACINGLFGTNYPPDAAIEYPNTETISAALKRRISDIFIKIEDRTYNIEIQSTVDKAIIVRIFEARFMEFSLVRKLRGKTGASPFSPVRPGRKDL